MNLSERRAGFRSDRKYDCFVGSQDMSLTAGHFLLMTRGSVGQHEQIHDVSRLM